MVVTPWTCEVSVFVVSLGVNIDKAEGEGDGWVLGVFTRDAKNTVPKKSDKTKILIRMIVILSLETFNSTLFCPNKLSIAVIYYKVN